MTDTPITTAPASPTLSAVISGVRYVITGAGSYAIAKGWLDQGTVNALVALAAAIIPPAYGVWQSYRNSHAIKAAAPLVPNSIIGSK